MKYMTLNFSMMLVLKDKIFLKVAKIMDKIIKIKSKI